MPSDNHEPWMEFSPKFDILYNNLMSNAAPEIDEYEKSVLLTKAQRELIKDYLRKAGNKYHEGIDDSKERFWNFSHLIFWLETYYEESGGGTISNWVIPKGDIEGSYFNYDTEEVLEVLNERVDLYKENHATHEPAFDHSVVVKPISYREYDRLQRKPFKYPKRGTAWSFQDAENIYIYFNPFDENDIYRIVYNVRVVRNPEPIITVEDLRTTFSDTSLYIDGKHEGSAGSLPASMYDEIIQRAVELAKASYSSDQSGQAQLQNQITVGQRSE